MERWRHPNTLLKVTKLTWSLYLQSLNLYALSIVEATLEAEQAADLSDQKQELLPVPSDRKWPSSALANWSAVEHPGMSSLMQYRSLPMTAHTPEQASLAGLTDLKGKHRLHSTPCLTLSQKVPIPVHRPPPGGLQNQPFTEAHR